MQRRNLLLSTTVLALLEPAMAVRRSSPPLPAMADIDAMAAASALAAGSVSAQTLLRDCLQRIDAIDRHGPRLNSVIELNPDALASARALDAQRKAAPVGWAPGPLHGLPVLLKDNIATADAMRTSAGSLALADTRAVRDAHLVQRLRTAGAVILGKTNLSEWANIRSTRSTSGWSARGGLTRNPYALDRSTSGSSSGTAAAIAAGLAPLGVGTETDGSIVSPASINGLVGLKPTVGRISRAGIIPISHTQDTAGPMTRSVADAALLYAVMAGSDADDAATAQAPPAGRAGEPAGLVSAPSKTPSAASSTSTANAWASAIMGALRADALQGARLGVARAYLTGFDEADAVFEQAVVKLRLLGAVVVDDVELPAVAYGDAELSVLLHEFKHGLAQWLAAYAPAAPVRTLADVIAFNSAHRGQEMPIFGQELFDKAQALGGLDSPAYRDALAACAKGARDDGLDRVVTRHRLDAVIAPTGGPAWLIDPVNGDHYGASFSTPAAVAGYPHLTVPCGQVRGLPLGLSFVGPAWSEWRLLALGHAYEQATRLRQPPRFLRRSVPV